MNLPSNKSANIVEGWYVRIRSGNRSTRRSYHRAVVPFGGQLPRPRRRRCSSGGWQAFSTSWFSRTTTTTSTTSTTTTSTSTSSSFYLLSFLLRTMRRLPLPCSAISVKYRLTYCLIFLSNLIQISANFHARSTFSYVTYED